jgi:peptidyl-prolyl cis-trans isomerase SurA
MKINSVLSLFLIIFVTFSVNAQDDKTILTIGDHTYPAGEFWHVYKKNKHLPGFDETPDVFANRFVNYKLKVVEAMNLGMDTLPTFLNEFNKYAEDLKASFLIDSVALEETAKAAHRNMQQVVNARHILIRLQPGSSPTDTLFAWNKLNEIRQRLLNGEDFGELASTYSEDPSAVQNKGELGYFSAFRMIYPFEKAAFETKVGEVSGIVRTDFGYHLIFIQERIPNPGTIKVAHIMKIFPNNATPEAEAVAKASIDSIYGALEAGAEFAQLARQYSDDGNSSSSGGEMRPFSLQEMVPEFAFAAFNLEADGDVSKPIRTDFGWHIIKRLERTPIGDYESSRSYIMNMMGRDGRDKAGQEAFLEQKKSSPQFRLNKDLLHPVFNLANDQSITNEDFFNRLSGSEEVLLNYSDKKVSLNDFIEVLRATPTFQARQGAIGIERLLDRTISSIILEVEKRDLGRNNPEYRYLVNEYHDGLLIFDLSNEEIWQKVGRDTFALHQHYNTNMSQFMEAPILNGVICEIYTKRLLKRTSKQLKSGDGASLVQILKSNARSETCYTCVEDRFPFVVSASNPVAATDLPEDNPFRNSAASLFWEGQVGEPELRPFEEIRGQVMSSYQIKLEEDWVNELRQNYNPIFDYRLLRKNRR